MIWHCAAVFFILVTPFLVFLKHFGYSYLQVEVMLSLLLIAILAASAGIVTQWWKRAGPIVLAAVITFLIDVQFDALNDGYAIAATFILLCAALFPVGLHAAQVLSAAGAVMLATTLLLPEPAQSVRLPAKSSPGLASLPLIVHIVLDEHIGVRGLRNVIGGEKLAAELRDFFRGHGFLLFENAYSEHFDTVRSLSHELNFSPGRYVPDLVFGGAQGYVWNVRRNAHFDRLIRDGYALRVYQSNYVNLCGGVEATADCEMYEHSGIAELQFAPLSPIDKTYAILNIYASRSRVVRELAFQYGKFQRRLLAWGIRMPVWQSRAKSVHPLISMKVMRRLTRDVAGAARGSYVFAHLLIPHSPYLFDAHCNLLQPADWLNRYAAEAPNAAMNTEQSRDTRYERYADQVRCVYRQLGNILDGIRSDLKEDAIIIIQGDHGSRITISDPDSFPERPSVEPRDYVDSYSTLFAVRSPKLAAGSNERLVSIACLLKALVEARYGDISGIPACSSQPAVLLSNGTDQIESRPLTPFD